MVLNAEYSILVSTVVLVLLPGFLELLYYCTHYAVRGGVSGALDIGCGTFDGNFANYYNYGRWYIGAALE